MMNKGIKIALVIKTEGLEYDDRVRKEILSVQKLFPQVRFKIFAMLPKNEYAEGMTSYGVPYQAVYVPSRDKYPSAQKAPLKAYEFYKAIRKEVERDFDAVWCANDDTVVVADLVRTKHLLWDLHELPTALLGNALMRCVLRYVFSRCSVVVHANPQRKEYLQSIGVIRHPEKHLSLRNYPNFDDVDKEYDEHYDEFVVWKGERSCVYLQGLDNQEKRASYESVKAVMMIPDLCAVVVGHFDESSKQRLSEEFGPELSKRVFFVGRVPQMKIPQFLRHCQLTVVLYRNISANNYYCEANRFYQAVIQGVPVVCGDNPPMRSLIEKYCFGVSIDGDGSDVDTIVDGVKRLCAGYDGFRENCIKHRDQLLWTNQNEEIKEIVQELLK